MISYLYVVDFLLSQCLVLLSFPSDNGHLRSGVGVARHVSNRAGDAVVSGAW